MSDVDIVLPARFDEEVLVDVTRRLASLKRRRMKREGRRAAVLVPLCHVDGRPAVLFTKRTETVGTHKGQVSFPGGRVDDHDVDDIDTALRECEEEIGIDRSRIRVLGLAHDAIAITGIAVTPVVGFIDGDLDIGALALSPEEIDVAFTLRLDELVDPSHRRAQMLGNRSAPLFSAGPHPVWGLTAWILDEVLRDGIGLALTPLIDAALIKLLDEE